MFALDRQRERNSLVVSCHLCVCAHVLLFLGIEVYVQMDSPVLSVWMPIYADGCLQRGWWEGHGNEAIAGMLLEILPSFLRTHGLLLCMWEGNGNVWGGWELLWLYISQLVFFSEAEETRDKHIYSALPMYSISVYMSIHTYVVVYKQGEREGR